MSALPHELAGQRVPATLEAYDALPHDDRRYFRRAAFGAFGEPGPELLALKQLLVERNDREGWFPEKWTDQLDEDTE